jgi:predicted nuclease of predicted toxin-antitoxin system
MRFLGDAGIAPKTIEFLRELGHGADHLRSLGMQRALDSEIMERARIDRSVVLTFDLDFGELLALGSLEIERHGGGV